MREGNGGEGLPAVQGLHPGEGLPQDRLQVVALGRLLRGLRKKNFILNSRFFFKKNIFTKTVCINCCINVSSNSPSPCRELSRGSSPSGPSWPRSGASSCIAVSGDPSPSGRSSPFRRRISTRHRKFGIRPTRDLRRSLAGMRRYQPCGERWSGWPHTKSCRALPKVIFKQKGGKKD